MADSSTSGSPRSFISARAFLSSSSVARRISATIRRRRRSFTRRRRSPFRRSRYVPMMPPSHHQTRFPRLLCLPPHRTNPAMVRARRSAARSAPPSTSNARPRPTTAFERSSSTRRAPRSSPRPARAARAARSAWSFEWTRSSVACVKFPFPAVEVERTSGEELAERSRAALVTRGVRLAPCRIYGAAGFNLRGQRGASLESRSCVTVQMTVLYAREGPLRKSFNGSPV